MSTMTITYELTFQNKHPEIVLTDSSTNETVREEVMNMPSGWQKFLLNSGTESNFYEDDVLKSIFFWIKYRNRVNPTCIPIFYKGMILSSEEQPKHLHKYKIVYDAWVCSMVRREITSYSEAAFKWADLMVKATEFCDNEPQAFNNLWKRLRVKQGKLWFHGTFRIEPGANSSIAQGGLSIGSLLHSDVIVPLAICLDDVSDSVLRSTESGVVLYDLSLLGEAPDQVNQARAAIQRMYEATSAPLIPANYQVTPLDELTDSELELEDRIIQTPINQLMFAAA